MIRGGCSVLAFLIAFPAWSGEATVAVAANFLTTAEALAEAYKYESGHEIVLAHGSTGRLYAQIVNGAPFDVFLAADAARPEALEEDDRTVERMTYALGRLVLVSREPLGALSDALKANRVALADPAVAPYGAAALQVLDAAGVSRSDADLVYGDSVGQVAALFATGNADLAFLAVSQLPALGEGSIVTELDGYHEPIQQDAVLLTEPAENEAAAGFFAFLAGQSAATLIAEAGYGVPR